MPRKDIQDIFLVAKKDCALALNDLNKNKQS